MCHQTLDGNCLFLYWKDTAKLRSLLIAKHLALDKLAHIITEHPANYSLTHTGNAFQSELLDVLSNAFCCGGYCYQAKTQQLYSFVCLVPIKKSIMT